MKNLLKAFCLLILCLSACFTGQTKTEAYTLSMVCLSSVDGLATLKDLNGNIWAIESPIQSGKWYQVTISDNGTPEFIKDDSVISIKRE